MQKTKIGTVTFLGEMVRCKDGVKSIEGECMTSNRNCLANRRSGKLLEKVLTHVILSNSENVKPKRRRMLLCTR